jgi:hypothetical protein
MLLYTTQWKIISYDADLKPSQLLWKQVKEHQLKISESCNRVRNETRYHLTDSCFCFICQIKSGICRLVKGHYIWLSSRPLRTKREILDLGGDILKFLFGTLTQSDARNYIRHITQLEE